MTGTEYPNNLGLISYKTKNNNYGEILYKSH